MPLPGFRLLLITDRHAVPAHRSLLSTVFAVLDAAPPGAVAVMLREKDLPGRLLFDLCLELGAICRSKGAALIVNDRVDVAKAAGAAGVHLPSAGLPPRVARAILGEDAIIGVSTHGLEDALRAAGEGADYVTFGPVYDTPSKRAYGAPVGADALLETTRRIDAAALPLAVYGLGGISSAGEAREVMEAGASGVACIRAVLAADDPGAAAAALLEALGQGA